MQIKTVRSTAQQNAKRDLAAVKEMAKTRGETYLEYAKNHLSRRDFQNAKATAIVGRLMRNARVLDVSFEQVGR